jgi:hypothetical protein
MIRIQTNADEVSARLAAFRTTVALVDWIDEATPVIVEALKKEAPYGPERGEPHLRDRIFGERHSAIGRVVGAFETDRSPLADWILGGTKPHQIRPKGNYPLRFYWDKVGSEVESWGWGGEKFGVANHPGTKANPFNVRAWLAAEEIVVDELVTTLREVLNG